MFHATFLYLGILSENDVGFLVVVKVVISPISSIFSSLSIIFAMIFSTTRCSTLLIIILTVIYKLIVGIVVGFEEDLLAGLMVQLKRLLSVSLFLTFHGKRLGIL